MTTDTSARTDLILAGVPEGLDALVLAGIAVGTGGTGSAKKDAKGTDPAKEVAHAGLVLHIVRDDRRMESLEQALSFFAPKVKVIPFPAWDTVPYDRVGPNSDILAKRIAALARLTLQSGKEPTIVLTTVNAVLQRVPPRAFIKQSLKPMAAGQRIDMARLTQSLQLGGFTRTGTVMEPGEYAVRGGILDLYVPGRSAPVRLDFFGDTLESIKSFDPQTQRTLKPVQKLALMPISEIAFGDTPTALFRRRYVELFGGATGDDPLYEAVSAGSRYPGQEHWLPLFHEKLETLIDYMPGVEISFDHAADEAVRRRFELIQEHYEARVEALEASKFGAPPYKPVPPNLMYPGRTGLGRGLEGPRREAPDAVRGRGRA